MDCVHIGQQQMTDQSLNGSVTGFEGSAGLVWTKSRDFIHGSKQLMLLLVFGFCDVDFIIFSLYRIFCNAYTHTEIRVL